MAAACDDQAGLFCDCRTTPIAFGGAFGIAGAHIDPRKCRSGCGDYFARGCNFSGQFFEMRLF
jgi:hypothetical protein